MSFGPTPPQRSTPLSFSPTKELLSPACGFIIIILLTSVHEEEEEHYVFDARDDDDDDDDGGDIEGRFSLRERLQVERDDDDDDEEDYSSF